ncbi:midnolin-like protein [Anopheles sinensis]|uniref:Midnolin-like protein n=1 Tax=Anopheles sinensis TaxID=74873 RepID=A0A084WA44_ANOSI|nr:midnolin-like protein [Anopheles sinensis]
MAVVQPAGSECGGKRLKFPGRIRRVHTQCVCVHRYRLMMAEITPFSTTRARPQWNLLPGCVPFSPSQLHLIPCAERSWPGRPKDYVEYTNTHTHTDMTERKGKQVHNF